MKLQAKERALLKVCFGLGVAACVLGWITGAGQTGVFATAYLSVAATCALWAYERNRPNVTVPAARVLKIESAAPQLSVRPLRAPEPAPSPRLTRSVAGIGFATLLLVSALAPVARPISEGLVIGAMTLGSVAAWGRLSEKDEQELELALPRTLRCPLCLELFNETERAAPCEGCHTIYHSECLEEWNQCAVLGCETTALFGPSSRVRILRSRGVRS